MNPTSFIRRHLNWRRFWPNSLAGRVAVIIAGGLLALLAVVFTVDWHDHVRHRTHYYIASMADRVIAVVEELDTGAPAERAALLRLLNTRHFHISLRPDKPVLTSLPWYLPATLEDDVRAQLAQLGSRQWLLGYVGRKSAFDREPDAEPTPGASHSRRHDEGDRRSPALAVAVALQDGQWAVFHISGPRPRPPRGLSFAIWLAVTAIVILAISVWAAHRMTKPLRQFASAADALGLDVRAPPLPEHGSRELRRATRAFNDMQARIRRLVDDRTMMLAAISHDLKTALTRLRLRAEFIEDEEQQAKALADLEEMQAMLDATLSFARDDAAEESMTALDLASMLQSLCTDHADAGHDVAYTGPDRLRLHGRPVALRRVFANLIDNAVRYGGSAEVDAFDDGALVTVTVSDRGPGIAEDRREDVFRPFYRLESSRNRDTGGTGLGLAVARSIVHRHGGVVSLAEREGGGLRVEVVLPRANSPTGS